MYTYYLNNSGCSDYLMSCLSYVYVYRIVSFSIHARKYFAVSLLFDTFPFSMEIRYFLIVLANTSRLVTSLLVFKDVLFGTPMKHYKGLPFRYSIPFSR